jgi:aminobenzoyl-glutamate transport protein
MRIKRIVGQTVLLLAIAQIVLVLVSWLIAAAMPELAVRSLLSSEGIRWFFGHFIRNLATPFLVWILLLCIAFGAIQESGLLDYFFLKRAVTYRQRYAMKIVFFELILFIAIMLLLTVMPHAILLSVTGKLFPSSFSDSIVAVICFALVVFSVTYGLMGETINNSVKIVDCLTAGIVRFRWVFLLYVLAAELYSSILFVFAN